jgi:hypothetical protein
MNTKRPESGSEKDQPPHQAKNVVPLETAAAG